MVVVDPDPGPLALAELKLAAARTLPLPTLRSLLGLDAPGRRLFLYHYVRDGRREGSGPAPPGLHGASRAWWDAREELVRIGLGERLGALDRGAADLRAHLRRLGLSGRVQAGFREDASSGWAGRRWSLALRLALGPRLSRDDVLRLQTLLPARAAARDPRVRLLLTGQLPPEIPPAPWLAPTQLRSLARGRVVPQQGEPGDLLAAQPAGSLSAVGLDLACAGLPLTADLLPAAARALRPGGLLLLRPPAGAGAPALPPALSLDPAATEALRAADRALLGGPPTVLRRR